MKRLKSIQKAIKSIEINVCIYRSKYTLIEDLDLKIKITKKQSKNMKRNADAVVRAEEKKINGNRKLN